MEVLRKGDEGPLVEQWQNFLVGQGLLNLADGAFGPKTLAATLEFQKLNGLKADGVVGNTTYGKAMTMGFEVIEDKLNDKTSAYWPPKPDFEALYDDEKRMDIWGHFAWKELENGKIEIKGNWEKKNIISVEVPQTKGLPQWGTPKKDTIVLFHKKAAMQLIELWAAWEKEGLLQQVVQWGGSYYPRYVRGSKTMLSNHAYGTAFDINVKWNGLAQRPALIGEHGCLRELVPIAHKYGFYWGGHFKRKDGMHFEVAKLL